LKDSKAISSSPCAPLHQLLLITFCLHLMDTLMPEKEAPPPA